MSVMKTQLVYSFFKEKQPWEAIRKKSGRGGMGRIILFLGAIFFTSVLVDILDTAVRVKEAKLIGFSKTGSDRAGDVLVLVTENEAWSTSVIDLERVRAHSCKAAQGRVKWLHRFPIPALRNVKKKQQPPGSCHYPSPKSGDSLPQRRPKGS